MPAVVYFEQFHLRCLSHASYMAGSGGVAAVVDPRRDVCVYVREAQRNGLRIGYVIATHLDAEFVSGHRELAEITGASLYAGARAAARFRHVPVRDHDNIRFGNCRLDFLETPGHTPESLSILVTDLERSAEPFAVLTGDTLLAGDVGRPAPPAHGSPRELAAELYGSLRKLDRLDDRVEVWPAHGAGSPPGRSTMAKERASNYALRARSRAAFLRLLASEVPEDEGGAAAPRAMGPLPALEPEEAAAMQRAGAVVLDTRPAPQFEGAHIAGALHIGLWGPYGGWAGPLVRARDGVVLVCEDSACLEASRSGLARAGVGRVAGYLGDSLMGWAARGLPLESVRRIGVEEAAAEPPELQVIDVRREQEWNDGHIRGARLYPLDRLREAAPWVDRARPVAVHCSNGYRSAIAASVLQAQGFREVADVVGGFAAWQAAGLPVAR